MKFKTNINCASCVAKVTPVLNNQEGVKKWEVDTTNPEKILTIDGEQVVVDDLIYALKKVGYSAIEIKD